MKNIFKKTSYLLNKRLINKVLSSNKIDKFQDLILINKHIDFICEEQSLYAQMSNMDGFLYLVNEMNVSLSKAIHINEIDHFIQNINYLSHTKYILPCLLKIIYHYGLNVINKNNLIDLSNLIFFAIRNNSFTQMDGFEEEYFEKMKDILFSEPLFSSQLNQFFFDSEYFVYTEIKSWKPGNLLDMLGLYYEHYNTMLNQLEINTFFKNAFKNGFLLTNIDLIHHYESVIDPDLYRRMILCHSLSDNEIDFVQLMNNSFIEKTMISDISFD